MAVMVLDPDVEMSLLSERVASEGNQYDEIWEGVYIVTPLPNNEHQELVYEFAYILGKVVARAKLGQVFPGVNLSDRAEGWKQNFREPDVAVFLKNTKAINHDTHWQGAADFLVEIISPGERTRDKIPFYGSIGVVELLIVDRDPWTLELYRHQDGQLVKVGQSSLEAAEILSSETVGLSFQLQAGESRPQIHAVQPATGREWLI